jgi:hypothetical protein
VDGDEVVGGPVSSCCPAYCETDGIIEGVISVPGLACANADLGGK